MEIDDINEFSVVEDFINYIYKDCQEIKMECNGKFKCRLAFNHLIEQIANDQKD